MSGASIEVRGLVHRYPGADVRALDDVSFTVASGQRLGLLGPNGAGKSTLMRLLCGYLPVHDGAVRVDGLNVSTHSLAIRGRVGYMPEHVPLYPELRVREHLAFRAAIKHVGRRRRGAEVERVADMTGLTERLQMPIGQLSRGYRQRVGIADALLGSPALLVLDEPTVGLDPNQVLDIRAMLRALGEAQTLVFSSHILAEVEALCDRVVILSRGAVVADESLADALAAGHITVRLVAELDAARTLVTAAWRALALDGGPEIEVRPTATADDVALSVELPPGGRDRAEVLLDAIGRECLQSGVVVRTLSAGRTRLEERFAAVTGAQRAS